MSQRYRPAPELRTDAMPLGLPVFASPEVPPQSIYISDHGWTVVRDGRVEQMPPGVYVYETCCGTPGTTDCREDCPTRREYMRRLNS